MNQLTIQFDATERERLNRQVVAIRDAMLADRREWTLKEMAEVSGASEAGASARLRECKKAKYGGHRYEKRAVGHLWLYRMVS